MPDKELVEAWREAAIAKNRGSERLAEMVTGSTRDEIFASAEAAAQRVQEIAGSSDGFDQVRQQAQDYYGRGPTTGGGGGVPSFDTNRDTAAIRRENAFAEKFNNAPRDAYGQRLGLSPHEITEYTSSRFTGQVMAKVREFARMTRSDGGHLRR